SPDARQGVLSCPEPTHWACGHLNHPRRVAGIGGDIGRGRNLDTSDHNGDVTWTMASSLLPSLASISILSILAVHHVIPTSASSAPLQCQSGWTNSLQTLRPSQINDGYCDCPLDGVDEPHTGACAGAMDGMWAGIPPKRHSSDYDAARLPQHFGCPQQPNLQLPLSRVDDGICDCCDGADESSSSSVKCEDNCEALLAEERAARAKAVEDYAVGSQKRQASITAYQSWYSESLVQLANLQSVDLLAAEKQSAAAASSLHGAKLSLAQQWRKVVKESVLGQERLTDIVGNGAMTVEDLTSFVISLCALSAELSSDNVASERCVALDRASLDQGLLWDYSSAGDDATLPSFTYLDADSEEALVGFADKIMLRLEGKDAETESSSTSGRHRKRPDRPPPSYDDSGDDPYGDDWEDGHQDYHYDDDYVDHEYHEDVEEDEESGDAEKEEDAETKEEVQVSDAEVKVKSLLEKIPLDRSLFKEQSKVLLRYAPPEPPKEDSGDEGETKGDMSDENSDGEGNGEKETAGGVDPMALQMTKSAVSKRLANIRRGEAAAKSAARFVAAVMEQSDSALENLQHLAILTIYHSNLSAADIVELVYSTSSSLSSPKASAGSGAESCSAPWSTICPPRTVDLQRGKEYPPLFLVTAAQTLCEEREGAVPACAVQEEDSIEFPSTLPDGYYNYYEPQPRGEKNVIAPLFSSADSLHETPTNLLNLRKAKEDVDKKKGELTRKIADLERQTSDKAKYGTDGELYSMRDTCHTVLSGKYEYEVCIFGKATQRDEGQKSGGTNLGNWEKLDSEDGVRTLKWGGGTKCWNGPVRSAEVTVTCGAETKLLTADEPETCRYVFTMESPIGCDEMFRQRNGL
ncbi:hypothetical protein ACHAXT_002225, partial [Thalassiosira profunda]